MEQCKKTQININQIIESESIKIVFQPIVSTYQGKVAGVEALVRGINPKDGSIISPIDLFELAKASDVVISLDRLCQRKAIELFGTNFPLHKDLILFLNVDNSVIHIDNNTNAIYEYTKTYNVSPQNVVLEINELHSADLKAVVRFTSKYRKKGFMISIDDIGAGYSNFDRVVLLKPDIIKIDMELIRDVHKYYYKQQVVEMIIRLGERIGSLVVAEGVEDIDEVMTVLKYGAHLLQGYYVAKPQDLCDHIIDQINNTVEEVALAQKKYLSAYITEKCDINEDLRILFEQIKMQMETELKGMEEHYLRHFMNDYNDVECIYIIDEHGKQITNTIFNNEDTDIHRKTLFSPYRSGDDATLKAYYYILKTTNQELYVSDEYLSLATGNRCITISGYCQIGEMQVILCLDIVKDRA